MKAIEEYPDTHVRCAFWLFIGTGARRSEVLKARWEDFNLDTATWRLPNPKSGHPQIIPLSAAMVEMLRATPRVPESPWLIPGKVDPQCHKVDLFRESARLYKAAKIVPTALSRLLQQRKRVALELSLGGARTPLPPEEAKALGHSTSYEEIFFIDSGT